MQECEIKKACEECSEEYKDKHTCPKDSGANGISVLACQIEFTEEKYREIHE